MTKRTPGYVNDQTLGPRMPTLEWDGFAFIAISLRIESRPSSPLPFGPPGSPLMATDMYLSIAGLTDNKEARRKF
jgi:hypothetical protein